MNDARKALTDSIESSKNAKAKLQDARRATLSAKAIPHPIRVWRDRKAHWLDEVLQ